MTDFFNTAQTLFTKALDNRIDIDDMQTIAAWPRSRLSVLFAATDQVRYHHFGESVSPCAIMNVKSGACPEDCAFCSQSCHNSAAVTVHGLSEPDEILRAYSRAASQGLAFGVVSSGKRLSANELNRLTQTLKQCNGPVHASLGLLSEEDFALLRDAGVVCYNHNIETSREFFPSIVTSHSFDDRIKTVQAAKAAGIKVCCGGIFGMGESWDDRISMVRTLRALDVDTVPLNFLNALPGTRVKPPTQSPLEFLTIIALFRLSLPATSIKVCGGREVNLRGLQPLLFFAGANGYISGDYLTTMGDSVASDDEMIGMLGLRKEDARTS